MDPLTAFAGLMLSWLFWLAVALMAMRVIRWRIVKMGRPLLLAFPFNWYVEFDCDTTPDGAGDLHATVFQARIT